MTDEEQDLIMALTSKRIGVDQFVAAFRTGSLSPSQVLCVVMQEAITARDPVAIEYALNLLYFCDEGSKYVDELMKLAGATWHQRHEDVVFMLGLVRDARAVEVLYRVAQVRLDYLEYNDSEALRSKALYALGNIGNQQAVDKLRLLSQSEDAWLRSGAQFQLNRIGRSPPRP